MTKNSIKVLIVDDSEISRELLAYLIGMDPDLSVIGLAENGEDALRRIQQNRPDVILTDLEMPIMNGFQLTSRLMNTNPIPIIVVSGAYNPSEIAAAFDAMDAGALAIIEKPKGIGDAQYLDTARFVTETIKTLAQVKLSKNLEKPLEVKRDIETSEAKWNNHPFDAIGIGASVGGPKAIRSILSQLSTDFPRPIFVVQHITAGFLEGFVQWLKGSSTLNVKIAAHGETPEQNTVYICPDNMVMRIQLDNTISLAPISNDQGSSHSISELFQSMAITYGGDSIGVLLTGVGADGAEGLLEMKNAGALTIVQNQETSIKFDMPKNAIDIEAAVKVLPLEQIATTLDKLTRGL
jgi:two-component system chemotaxis response regulator CheB